MLLLCSLHADTMWASMLLICILHAATMYMGIQGCVRSTLFAFNKGKWDVVRTMLKKLLPLHKW
jgi:hypothetical protein